MHSYIEETGKIFGLGASAGEEFEARRNSTQTNLVAQWKDTVGGYFRRFQPDFGDVVSVEGVLMYAFLKADMDFITKTRPWFLKQIEGEKGEGNIGAGGDSVKAKANPFKGGSTASLALISTA